MFDKSKPFWNRGDLQASYVGLVQRGDTCVFASIAGVMNHLCQRNVWSWESLHMAYQAQEKGSPIFGTVLKVATGLGEVKENLRYELLSFAFLWHIDDEKRQEPVSQHVEAIRNCVASGGIAIVSVEGANEKKERIGRWHMLTLVAYKSDWYQVWDTNNRKGVVGEEELTSGIHNNGEIPWMVLHDRHDAVLFWPKWKTT